MERLVQRLIQIIILSVVLSSCGNEPNVSAIVLRNENSSLAIKIVQWEEGFEVFQINDAPDGTTDQKLIMQSVICNKVNVFWKDRSAVSIVYDDIEMTYFSSYSDDNLIVRVCKRGSVDCGPEPKAPLSVKGCRQ